MVKAPVTAKESASAAVALLRALDPEQRAKATFEFGSLERENWHYVLRSQKGLPRMDLDARQLEAAEALLGSGLSKTGLKKAKAIIRHELVLARTEGSAGVSRSDRDPGLYFFTIFGAPDGEGPWGWRVEGHHLSLNFTVVGGGTVSATPSFFGANPAEVRQGPEKGLRILREEEDLAGVLFARLNPGQRRMAVIYPVAPPDLITRASPRVEIAKPVGLPAELMSADQRRLLMRLLKVYIEREPPDVAARALRRVEANGINNIFFGWAGVQGRGQKQYYRVHGPSVFVEYDNTQDGANHIHSVWRDIKDDFGLDLLKAHYERDHG